MVGVIFLLVLLIALLRWGFAGDKKAVEAEGGRPCPNCGYDLRGGHERCPECGAAIPLGDDDESPDIYDDLFLATPLEPRNPGPDEKLVIACDTSSIVEAAFLSSLLENHGIIPVREGQPRPTDYQPVSMRLMVRSNDGEAAGALIAEVRRRQAERRGVKAES